MDNDKTVQGMILYVKVLSWVHMESVVANFQIGYMEQHVLNLDYPQLYKYKIKNMGYHKITIPKGTLGEFSKSEEEFLELKDGFEQDDKILQIVELTDLIGAIDAYSSCQFGLSLGDLIKFTRKTQQAFDDGSRK